jgi:hypothetical protein
MAEKPKVGEYIALTWKNSDGTIWEGTEGFVAGVVEDNKRVKHLLIDRSTYSDSLKSFFYSLGIMDLFMVDSSEIESIISLEQRDRPPGIQESLKCKMETDYKSNIDYESTQRIISEKNSDCLLEENQPAQTNRSETFTVKINTIPNATINFSPLGNVQIHCSPKQLNSCIEWLKSNVAILPEHKHLVLIPTHFMLNMHDNFKENAEPTEQLIERLATIRQKEAIIFPLGWVNHFFNDSDGNALNDLFPDSDDLEHDVLRTQKGKKNSYESNLKTFKNNFIYINFGFSPNTITSIGQPLSAEPQTVNLEGMILKNEEANGMKDMWFRTRFEKYVTLNNTPPLCPNQKVLIRNVIIDRNTGRYNIGFKKYYQTDFEKLY